MMRKSILTIAATAVLVSVTSAFGAPMLTVTEAYVGVPGNDLTEDWFEITNMGDAAWDLTTDPLWYDDEGMEVGKADPINGISSIGAGETIVIVLGETTAAVTEFISVWGSGNLTGVQIGYADGSGLGQGGDGVTIFDDLTAPLGNVITFQGTPDYDANLSELGNTGIYKPSTGGLDDFARDGIGGAWIAPGGPAGDSGEYPLVGSPGVVPEPASLMLLSIGGLALIRRR